jgi:hypothetical protein
VAALFVAVAVMTPVVAVETMDVVVPKEKIMLWNGKDFTGWTRFLRDSSADVDDTWSVASGVLRCTGKPAGYMRTKKAYADYHLHVEWRWPEKPGNNGVLVHTTGKDTVWPKSLECQLASGNAGDFWVIGGVETAEHAKGGPRVATTSSARTIGLSFSSTASSRTSAPSAPSAPAPSASRAKAPGSNTATSGSSRWNRARGWIDRTIADKLSRAILWEQATTPAPVSLQSGTRLWAVESMNWAEGSPV